jgi:predicted transcriptional regulator
MVTQTQREKHRTGEEIIVELLRTLRSSQNGLTKNKLMDRVVVTYSNRYLFEDYMVRSGLIKSATSGKMSVELTDKGQTIPLEPEEFSDFKYEGGIRSRFGVRRDVIRVIYGHEEASLTDILIGALSSWNKVRKHVDELERDNMVVRNQNGKYEFTEVGLSKIQSDKYPPIERIRRPITSGVGETLTRMLEAAHDGGKRGMRELAPTLTSHNLSQYVGILYRYQLLGGHDGEFYTTTNFYEGLDKEALVYSLDILAGSEISKNKSGTSVEWNILQGLSRRPGSITDLRRIRGEDHSVDRRILRGDNSAYKKHLTALKREKYVSSFRQGGSTIYELTPRGDDLVDKVNKCVEQLRSVEQLRLRAAQI